MVLDHLTVAQGGFAGLRRAILMIPFFVLTACGGGGGAGGAATPGGGSSSGGSSVPTVPPLATQSLTVTIDSDVPSVAMANISALVTPLDSEPVGTANLTIPAISANPETVVVALDANNNMMLAAMVDSASSTISANSTAIALVRVALGTLPSSVTPAQANTAITGTADFSALVTQVNASLSAGSAPALSTTVAQAVVTVINDLNAANLVASAAARAHIFAIAPTQLPGTPQPLITDALFSVTAQSVDNDGTGINATNSFPIQWTARTLQAGVAITPVASPPINQTGDVQLLPQAIGLGTLSSWIFNNGATFDILGYGTYSNPTNFNVQIFQSNASNTANVENIVGSAIGFALNVGGLQAVATACERQITNAVLGDTSAIATWAGQPTAAGAFTAIKSGLAPANLPTVGSAIVTCAGLQLSQLFTTSQVSGRMAKLLAGFSNYVVIFKGISAAVSGTNLAALVYETNRQWGNANATTTGVCISGGQVVPCAGLSATAYSPTIQGIVGDQIGPLYPLIASGDPTPYTYTYGGSLPPGLSLNSQTGAVSGVPTAAGTFTPVFSVQGADGVAAQITSSVTFNIAAPPPPMSGPGFYGYVLNASASWSFGYNPLDGNYDEETGNASETYCTTGGDGGFTCNDVTGGGTATDYGAVYTTAQYPYWTINWGCINPPSGFNVVYGGAAPPSYTGYMPFVNFSSLCEFTVVAQTYPGSETEGEVGGGQFDGQNCGFVQGDGTCAMSATIIPAVVPTFTITGLNNIFQNSPFPPGEPGVSITLCGSYDVTGPPIYGDGNYSWQTFAPAGCTYSVDQPVAPATADVYSCSEDSPTGMVSVGLNINIACSFTPYTLGGTVSGLNGSVTLANNASDLLTIGGNVSFTFPTALNYNQLFSVTVRENPAGQVCTVGNGTGQISGNVTTIAVMCQASSSTSGDSAAVTVAGAVSGLNAAGFMVVLTEFPSDSSGALSTTASPSAGATSVTFTGASSAPSGTPYSVGIVQQPTGETCVVSGGAGFVGVDVPPLQITCGSNSTTALVGSYNITGQTAVLTFFGDGTYVMVTDNNSSSCSANRGDGVEYGTYSYAASTGLLKFATNVVDTNGSCGVWNAAQSPSGYSGILQKSQSGQNGIIQFTSSSGTNVGVPVPSLPSTLVGSFQVGQTPNVIMFSDSGEYLFANTQNDPQSNNPAGIEIGCYTASGSTSGTLSVTSSCSASVQTDGLAGLLDSGPVSYSITGANTVQLTVLGEVLTLNRIIPN